MSIPGTYKKRGSLLGVDFEATTTITSNNGAEVTATAIGPAKVGQLTTRTNNTDGTLTMTTGHGITTGARLDVYWTEGTTRGTRRGVVVGTVATNSVPITGGAGDNLPTNLTAVTAMVPTSRDLTVTGNNVTGIVAKCIKQFIVVFTNVVPADVLGISITVDGNAYVWYSGIGQTNPLAAAAPIKVYMSHGDSTGARDMTVAVQYD